MSSLNFINLGALIKDIKLSEVERPRQTRYRVVLDLTLDDDPTQWDWEDLLEIEDPEKVNSVTFEEYWFLISSLFLFLKVNVSASRVSQQLWLIQRKI